MLFQDGVLVLVDFQRRHHVFSSDVADDHAEWEVFGVRVFLENVQSGIFLYCIWDFLVFGR